MTEAGIWVDPDAVDANYWHRVQLHAPLQGATGVLRRQGFLEAKFASWAVNSVSTASFGQVPGGTPAQAEVDGPAEGDDRMIPAACVRRLPLERARVTRLPARVVSLRRRRRLFLLPSVSPEQRRGRAAAWGLLVVWLIGTWGTFYGLTGGLKSNIKSKAIVASSSWGW